MDERPLSHPHEGPLHVLVVEHDVETATTILGAVRSLGMRPALAGRLAEARDLLRRARIDVALVDAVLPDGAGIGLLDDIRTLPSVPAVIIHEAADVEPDILGAWRSGGSGAADYLPRPISTEALRESFLRVSGRRRRHRYPAPGLPDSLVTYLDSAQVRPLARAIFLRRWQGEKNHEIAAALECSVSKVKAYLRDDIIQPLGADSVLDCSRAARDWCNRMKSDEVES